MCVVGYQVTMQIWVECPDTHHTLLEPQRHTCTVQPPMWVRDDAVGLEMYLDHMAKMHFLVELRKNLTSASKIVEQVKTNKFAVRGMMESWSTPQDQQGNRKETVFPADRLRYA